MIHVKQEIPELTFSDFTFDYCESNKSTQASDSACNTNDEKHVEVKTSSKNSVKVSKFVCKSCSLWFMSEDDLKEHSKKHVKKRIKSLNCLLCDQRLRSRFCLAKHMIQTHHCSVTSCFEQMEETNNRKKDEEPKTIQTESIRYECDICQHEYSTQLQLNRHLKTHSNKRPYSCSMCNKSYARKDCLARHVRVHAGEKNYSCSSCNKRFAYKHLLVDHEGSHSDVKFSCSFCEKLFSSRKSLKWHEKIHQHINRYPCKFCEKKFLRPYELKHHLTTHTGEKLYSCPLCRKPFTFKQSLTRHLQQHTGKNEKLF